MGEVASRFGTWKELFSWCAPGLRAGPERACVCEGVAVRVWECLCVNQCVCETAIAASEGLTPLVVQQRHSCSCTPALCGEVM